MERNQYNELYDRTGILMTCESRPVFPAGASPGAAQDSLDIYQGEIPLGHELKVRRQTHQNRLTAFVGLIVRTMPRRLLARIREKRRFRE